MNKLTRANIPLSDKNFRMAMYSKLRDYESSELTPKQVVALRDALAEMHDMAVDLPNATLDMKKIIKNAQMVMSIFKTAVKAKAAASELLLQHENDTHDNTEQQDA